MGIWQCLRYRMYIKAIAILVCITFLNAQVIWAAGSIQTLVSPAKDKHTPKYPLSQVDKVFSNTITHIKHLKDIEDLKAKNTKTEKSSNSCPIGSIIIAPPKDPNHAPALNDIPFSHSINENKSLWVNIEAIDLDGDKITYSWGNPTYNDYYDKVDKDDVYLNSSTGLFMFMPDYDDEGSYIFKFTASDGEKSSSKHIYVTVNNVNAPPQFVEYISWRKVDESDSLSINLKATDIDRDPITYSWESLLYDYYEEDYYCWDNAYYRIADKDDVQFDSSRGTFSFSPDYDDNGDYLFRFTASDGKKSSCMYTHIYVKNVDAPLPPPVEEIPPPEETPPQDIEEPEDDIITEDNVNHPPEIEDLSSIAIKENEHLELKILADDPDGDDLIYSVKGLPEGASFDIEKHTFEWKPDFTQADTYTVTFEVSDKESTVTKDVIINVHDVNRPPEIRDISNIEIEENEHLELDNLASDPDDDSLTFSSPSLPKGASINSYKKTFIWKPALDQSGEHKVVINVVDEKGGEDAISFTIKVKDLMEKVIEELDIQLANISSDLDFITLAQKELELIWSIRRDSRLTEKEEEKILNEKMLPYFAEVKNDRRNKENKITAEIKDRIEDELTIHLFLRELIVKQNELKSEVEGNIFLDDDKKSTLSSKIDNQFNEVHKYHVLIVDQAINYSLNDPAKKNSEITLERDNLNTKVRDYLKDDEQLPRDATIDNKYTSVLQVRSQKAQEAITRFNQRMQTQLASNVVYQALLLNRDRIIDDINREVFLELDQITDAVELTNDRFDSVHATKITGIDTNIENSLNDPTLKYSDLIIERNNLLPLVRDYLAEDEKPSRIETINTKFTAVRRIQIDTAAGMLLETHEYDNEGNVLTTIYMHDMDGNTIRKINPDSSYIEYFYNSPTLTSYHKYLTNGDIEIFNDSDALIYKYEASGNNGETQDLASLLSIATSTGDVIRYLDGEVFSITLDEDGSTMTNIEFYHEGNLKNAQIKHLDGSIDVIYDGKVIQRRLPDGTLLMYREDQKTIEYSSLMGLTYFCYIPDENGDVAYIRVANNASVCIYDPNGNPIKFLKPKGAMAEYEDAHLKRLVTQEGEEYLYTYTDAIGEELPKSVLIGDTNDDSLPAVIYYDEYNRISKVSNAKGDTITYRDGLVDSISRGSDLTQYDYVFNEANGLEKITIDRAGIERIYDELGNLESLSLDNGAKIVYKDGEVQYIEKADGTKISGLTMFENGDIDAGLISYPDGSVALYSDGELLESISEFGDTISYLEGKIETLTLNDGSVYDWSYEDDSVKIYDHANDEYRWYLEGRLRKVEDLSGAQLVTNYYYGDENKLSKSSVSSGNDILYTYSYTYEDNLTLVHDEDSNIQAYNADKKLIYLIDSKGRKYTYTYVNEDDGYIKVLTPNLSEVRYDTDGNIIEIFKPDGTIIQNLTFNNNGLPEEFTYIKDNETYVVQDGKIKEIITGEGNNITYNLAGFLESIKTSSGEEKYEYIIDDEHSSVDIDGFSFDNENLEYDGSSIKIKAPFDYGEGGDGALVVNAGQTVYIDGTKEYESIYVAKGGILAVSPWNGTSGGLATLRSRGPVVIKGVIDVRGKGCRGGINNPATNRNFGDNQSGESYNGLGAEGQAANYGGGGGGRDGQNHQPNAPGGAGGGGGGYGTKGTPGQRDIYGCPHEGYRGNTYGSLDINQLYRGSGGGSGGDYTMGGWETPGGNGGRGGGAIYIAAPNIVVSGTISADGEDGKDGKTFPHPGATGGGGGGSGGTIWLKAESINLTHGAISVNGGKGGDGKYGTFLIAGDGGDGGYGRIRLDYVELIGATPKIPTLYTKKAQSITKGELFSDVIEVDAKEYNTFSWSEDLPENTDITFQTRTGNTPTVDHTWSAWSNPLTGSTGTQITSPTGKYIQYKAILSKTNSAISPTLHLNNTRDINITYTRDPIDYEDIENLAYIKVMRDDVTATYDADGVNVDDPADTIDTTLLIFDRGYFGELEKELPTYILNETQRAIYLNNDIVISELKSIRSIDGTIAHYTQGKISVIEFSDSSFIQNLTFNNNGLPEEFTYIKDNETYVVQDGKIKEIITGEGNNITYNLAGFLESIKTSSGEEKYEYIIDDEHSSVDIDGFSFDNENLEYDGSSIKIKAPFDYGEGGDGALVVNAGQTVYIDGTKEYESIYVAKGGILAVSPWNGTSGGLATLRSRGPVVIKGVIDVRGKGCRGGINNPATNRNFGDNQSGESYNGLGAEGQAANYGGGGGGRDGQNHQPNAPGGAGGGGGGYGTKGTPGQRDIYGCPHEGYRGNTYGSLDINQLYRGSGGGSGGDYTMGGWETPGGNGGRGGGAIYIAAPNIVVSGTISADGEDGKDGKTFPHPGATGGGGGGSGGTIWLKAESINLTHGAISVNGGKGGDGKYGTFLIAGDGGDGGYGRIRLDYVELIGATPKIPTLYTKKAQSITKGELFSDVIEVDAKEYNTFSWSEDLPENTDITFQTRTGNTPTVDHTWSAWSNPLTGSTGTQITSPTGKYIQYKAILSKTNSAISPTLHLNNTRDINITYTRDPIDYEDIENLAYIKVMRDDVTATYDADGVNVDDPADTIDTALLTFDPNYFDKIIEEIPSHRLNSSQNIITAYNKTSDNPIYTISADHSITYYDENRVSKVGDKNGTALVQYIYGEKKKLLGTEFVEARKSLEEGYKTALEGLVTQKNEALVRLVQAEEDAKKDIEEKAAIIQAQIDAERKRLELEKAKYDPNIYDLSEFNRVFRELDEYEDNLYAQRTQALIDVDNQIAKARANINIDSKQAMHDLLVNDYNVALGDIVQKESSPVVFYYYRNVLGRDPDDGELEYWLNKAKADLAAVDPTEITQYLQELPEYLERENWKENIIAEVTSFFDKYLQASDDEKELMLSLLGLEASEVEGVNLIEEDIDDIVAWLEAQSLHFGDSAFKTVIDLLAKEDMAKTFEEIGRDCLKVDILTGVITKDTEGALVISMYAMKKIARVNGLTLYAEKIDFDELKAQLTLNDSIILHINNDHYVVLKGINEGEGTVTYKDLSVGAEGQDISLSRAEFMEEWKGYALSKNQIIDSEGNKYLNDSQAKNIRGAGWFKKIWKKVVNFFQKIIAPVASVMMLLPGLQPLALAAHALNVVVQTVSFAVGTGDLMDVVWSGANWAGSYFVSNFLPGAFDAVGKAFSSIGKTIFAPIKGAFNFAVPIFNHIANAVQNVATGIGNIFNTFMEESIATSLTTNVIGTAVNIGASEAFESMGMNPDLTNFTSALVSGATMGMANPDMDIMKSTLTSGTIVGTREIGEAAGVDPRLTHLAAIAAGTAVGGVLELDGGTYTQEQLLNDLTVNIASEATYIGIQELGDQIGIDSRISYLAGVPVKSSISAYLSGADSDTIWTSVKDGMLRGITSITIESALQEADIDPLIGSVATAAIAGSIEALLEEQNPMQGVFDTYFNSANGLLTLGGPGATEWEKALYMSKILDFSEIIQEQGIGDVLETYATAILHQQTINNIWKLGGIYDLLANQDQIEIVINKEGIEVKRIYTNEEKTDYIELSLNDDRLMGKKEGNIIMHCDYVKGPDGKFKMKNGEIEHLSEDETYIERKDIVKDFKLVEIIKYDRDENEREKILSFDSKGIQINDKDVVVHGLRKNYIDKVNTFYEHGKVTMIELDRQYLPSEEERALLFEMRYTEEDIKGLSQVFIYDTKYGKHALTSKIRKTDGSLMKADSDKTRELVNKISERTNKIWEYAKRLASEGIPKTSVELYKNRGVAEIDMELTWPDGTKVDKVDFLPAGQIVRYIFNNKTVWTTAIMDAVTPLASIIANNDADFIFMPGINTEGKTADDLYKMKMSLETTKKVVFAHSAGTELAIRSTFIAKADKYIIASPRMTPEAFYAIIQKTGVRPEQVIIVSMRGDFWNHGGTYEDHGPEKWTSIYIEDGPGVGRFMSESSHSIPIEGWLNEDVYKVRINGEPLLENMKLSDIYKQEVNR
ncbi:Ig-like domain-containing protein [Candidatus Omnitrophota bacterium]